MKGQLVNDEKENAKPKYIYLEFMRIIAVFFVIFNHTRENGFVLFTQYPIGGFRFYVYLAISVFCKFSVPLFFAISGALLLKRKGESLKDLWKNRILKMIVVLVVFSVIYYLNTMYKTNGVPQIKEFLKLFYTYKIEIHLWYIYAYITFLICLPFLRAMVRHLKNQYFYYMFLIVILYGSVVPTIEFLGWQGRYVISEFVLLSWLTTTTVIYPCLGYFIQNRIQINKTKKIIPILWILNIGTIFLTCYMTYYNAHLTGECNESVSQNFHNIFVIFNCITVYITIKYIFEHVRCSKAFEKIICSIGKCTFGIYLLHFMIKDSIAMQNLLSWLLKAGVNDMVSVFIQCFCVMMIAWAMTWLFRKIPIVKKLF